ncbi:CoA pyrophosphatase [Chitinibacter tainanensis]|uniref:CoA pyrophosphatase n=1 Tax=Chitinibacter tainanensis TaxID=230667 RepID=UPI000A03FEB3|nr:CoA pyrophosphatase [Chitinibacter tainanensis]
MMWPAEAAAFQAWAVQRLQGVTWPAAGDGARQGQRPAAVLVGVVLREELSLLLTQRAAHLAAHAGQISFPGGGVEAQDDDRIATALRETVEEVGIDPQHISPWCQLGHYHTISGYCVTPVLAGIDPAYQAQPDHNEVADVFEIPLAIALDPARYARRRVQRGTQQGEALFLSWQDRLIWGATAGMLLQLSSALGLPGIPMDARSGEVFVIA